MNIRLGLSLIFFIQSKNKSFVKNKNKNKRKLKIFFKITLNYNKIFIKS
jgi:hypothetical protein